MERSYSCPTPDDLLDSANRLRGHVQTLAELGSRYWNTPGYAAALDYAEGQFAAFGYTTRRQPFEVDTTKPERGFNLLADREEERGEYPQVVVGAHLDSYSPEALEGGLAPGADDNASGCAIALEAARFLREREIPLRVRFVLFGAEEIGLHGSAAYVTALRYHERKELKRVWILDQAGLNTRPEPTVKLEGYRIRSGPLIKEAEAAAPSAGLKTAHTYHPYGSDHMPFLKAKIPALLLIQPDDEDDPHNHTPQDTSDRIDYDYMARILMLLTHILTA